MTVNLLFSLFLLMLKNLTPFYCSNLKTKFYITDLVRAIIVIFFILFYLFFIILSITSIHFEVLPDPGTPEINILS